MIQNIIKDESFLSIKSEESTIADMQIGIDLIDTLEAHSHECVGMAANMIGCSKNIIIVNIHEKYEVMFNPVILSKENMYQTSEGCLSLEGQRECTRYKNIVVEYYDMKWKKVTRKLSGFTAQIVQHEVDHLDGIII